MGETALRIPFLVIQQNGKDVYQFSLSAFDLAKLGQVDRFGEASDGVNRQLDERHALDIAQAMTSEDEATRAYMLEPILGDLKGGWRKENGFLIPVNGAYLSLDDGQHRWWVCKDLLTDEERAQWTFPVTATQGLDFNTRLRIFRQQGRRKKIDSKLDLAQRYTLDDWNTPAEREAYNLLLTLQSDPNSPLQGMIILGETIKRTYEHQHRPEGINANGVWRTFVRAMSKGSPIYPLSIEKRVEVVRNMIWLASETWPNAWKSNNHILTTARGINAVVLLLLKAPAFRGSVGDDFTVDSLRKAFGFAKKFRWDASTYRNYQPQEITEAINRAIETARNSSQVLIRA
jgi:hypothetical protein